MTVRTTTRTASQYIAALTPFTTSGALFGNAYPRGFAASTGRLDAAERDEINRNSDRIDYVVYSYNTPIAWHTPKGWHIVDQKFSMTTSKHQSQVRLAVL